MSKKITPEIEKIFLTSKVPNIVKEIEEYSANLWPRFVYQFDPETKKFIGSDRIRQADLVNSLEEASDVILRDLISPIGIYPPYFRSVLDEVLYFILKQETYLERPFIVKISPFDKIIFVPEGSSFQEETEKTYDIGSMINETLRLNRIQSQLSKIFRNLADSGKLRDEDIKSLVKRGWNVNVSLNPEFGAFWRPLAIVTDSNVLDLLLRNGADPNGYNDYLAGMVESLLQRARSEPEYVKKIENKAKLFLDHGWRPMISREDLENLRYNTDYLKEISPILFNILKKAEVY